MSDPIRKEFKKVFSSLLNGRFTPWSKTISPLKFIEIVGQNQLGPLVCYFLKKTGSWDVWPKKIRDGVEREGKRQFLIEDHGKNFITELIDQFSAMDIPSLIFKGSALSFLNYPSPGLRPRCDTDLLIKKEDVSKAHDVFMRLGYRRDNMISGELISYQCTYSKEDSLGLSHTFDLHWQVYNPQLFAELFTFDELYKNSVKVASLSSNARALNSDDALLVSCLHRVAHHMDDENLLWLYDIHLLTKQLSLKSMERVFAKAKEKNVMSILAAGLSLAKYWFGTPLPKFVISDREISSVYLNPNRRWFHDVFYDFVFLKGWYKRSLFLWEHAFPNSDYISRKYSVSNRLLLPGLYMFRIVAGLRKILTRSKV